MHLTHTTLSSATGSQHVIPMAIWEIQPFVTIWMVLEIIRLSEISQMNKDSQFSRSVVSDSLRPHEPQHTRPSCLSPNFRVYPNQCSLTQGCHPTISSSVIPFSSCPQSFPASGSFHMSQLFTLVGQSIGISTLASVLPMNTQD